MTSETFVFGEVSMAERPVVGALVRRFAAGLGSLGHVEACVERRGERLKVKAEAFPHTAPSFDVSRRLEAVLTAAVR